MAMKPENPGSGFRHSNVLAFINERMARHATGPQFYLENLTLSWEEVEDKFRAILEDHEMPSEALEACAWSSLALGVRFARRQSHLQRHRVQWLHDFARLHKSAAHTLASDLKQLSEQQEMERKEAAFQLRLARTKLTEVQRERDLLRWKLLQAVSCPLPTGPGRSTATAGGAGMETQGAGDKEKMADIVATATGRGGRVEETHVAEVAAPWDAPQEQEKSFLQLLGVEEWNYPLGRNREGDLTSAEMATFSLPGIQNPRPIISPDPFTVQLPASFSYCYESPFPVRTTQSPPPTVSKPPVLPTMLSYCVPSEISLLSDMGAPGVDLQETQRDRRESELQQQRKATVFRRPGDWDCPWCKAVNFSRRENCFCCGRGLWLQSP
uniref:RanBP2-type domain-containing protein n=1 Tax=Castor canadensis TaxID=51338 RepID=A0A8C0XBU8_CASCN